MADGTLGERIATWEPATLGGFDEAVVEFVRAAVAAAGPREWPEARNGLRWGVEYVTWARQADIELDARELFTAERVGAYKATVLRGPEGTRVATVSILKRMHPDVGFAGTTRPGRESALVSPVVLPASGRAQHADVDALIDGYVPTLVDPAAWAPVESMVRDIVRAARPASTRRAVTLCRDMAYLAVWAAGDHRVVSIDTTLAAATIETFLTVLVANGLPNRSVASFAANLHLLRELHGVPLDAARRSFPAPDPKAPYDQADIDRLFEAAARVPHRARRRHLRAALVLLFGVGAGSGEIADLVPGHIVDIGGGLAVELTRPGRRVAVLEPYAADLRAVRADAVAAGDRYLIGGHGDARRHRIAQLFTGKKPWRIDIDPNRARAAWLVETAATPGWSATVVDLLDASGHTTLNRIDELLPHIRQRRHELLTGSPLPTPWGHTVGQGPPIAGDRVGEVA